MVGKYPREGRWGGKVNDKNLGSSTFSMGCHRGGFSKAQKTEDDWSLLFLQGDWFNY